MKSVLSLSGGLDSTTLLTYLLNQGYEVHAVSFKYGSKHNPFELEAVNALIPVFIREYPNRITFQRIDVSSIFEGYSTALINSSILVPEGHYNEDTMKQTVVPGRNLIFASILASIAENIGASHIALGVHAGDHHIYPDCRPDFLRALADTIMYSSESRVKITAPFEYMSKTDILRYGMSQPIKLPYHLTRTCYKPQEKACGVCGSCQERLEAFATLELKDPIIYE
jgi:7-cyano-7-deazaguanine synthase